MTSAASLLLKCWEAAVALAGALLASAIAHVLPAAAAGYFFMNVAFLPLTTPNSCKPSGRACEMKASSVIRLECEFR